MESIIRFLKDCGLTFDRLTALMTFLTAVAAIVISIITYRSQVKHNKNSVKPILNVSLADYVGHITVKIKNKGVGPATISSVACLLTVNDQQINKGALIKYFSDFDFLWTTFTDDISGFTIAPDGEITLLEANSTKESSLVEIRKRLKNIEVTVEYVDIYGDKMEPAKRKLDWFGRTLGDTKIQLKAQ